jgi:putative ABC transport system substrate-binding protein
MIRKIVVCLLINAVLLTVSLADAQQQAKIIKIGWLASGPVRSARFESYKQALRALGYVEGKNIFIEVRSAEGKLDRLPALVDELVRL